MGIGIFRQPTDFLGRGTNQGLIGQSRWQGYVPRGQPIPGALDFVETLLDQGIEVIVSSCRAYTSIGRIGVREWLEKHGFKSERIHVTHEKPHADWYVDDRAIRFNGDFHEVLVMMEKEPWYKPATEEGVR